MIIFDAFITAQMADGAGPKTTGMAIQSLDDEVAKVFKKYNVESSTTRVHWWRRPRLWGTWLIWNYSNRIWELCVSSAQVSHLSRAERKSFVDDLWLTFSGIAKDVGFDWFENSRIGWVRARAFYRVFPDARWDAED
jgi:hypothetical protein